MNGNAISPSFSPKAGSTLAIPTGGKHHLFVFLTHPCPAGKIASVSFSRVKAGSFVDPACVFPPGAHPFVRFESFAYYRLARIDRVNYLQAAVANQMFIPDEPVAATVLSTLQQGALDSDFIPYKIRQYIAEQLGIGP